MRNIPLPILILLRYSCNISRLPFRSGGNTLTSTSNLPGLKSALFEKSKLLFNVFFYMVQIAVRANTFSKVITYSFLFSVYSILILIPTYLSKFSLLFVAPKTIMPSFWWNLKENNLLTQAFSRKKMRHFFCSNNYLITYPSISARSWFIVWLAYGCNWELLLFAPTASISSRNTTHGARNLAAPTIRINSETPAQRYNHALY